MQTKFCARCKLSLDVSEFVKIRGRKGDGLHSWCKSCVSSRVAELQKTHPERTKRTRRKYRIKHLAELEARQEERYTRMRTKIRVRQLNARGAKLDEQVVDLALAQNSYCEICGESFSLKSPHIDHDHKTGEFRGVLCRKCNIGLGLFQDNSVNLRRAVQYLERNQEKVSSIEVEGKTMEGVPLLN